MCMCVYIYVSLCVWVCVFECMCECVGDCVYVCMYATVYMYVCVTMSVYICVTVCVYSLHTGTQMLVCECTWVWKPEIRRRHHSSASSHPLHYLRQGFNWPEACWLHEPSCLRNSKAPTFLYLPSSGIARAWGQTWLATCIQYSCLPSKSFTSWAISTTPNPQQAQGQHHFLSFYCHLNTISHIRQSLVLPEIQMIPSKAGVSQKTLSATLGS
jgi:hypothetical protein